MLRPLPIVLLLAAGLGACAVGPDYRSPNVTVSPEFVGRERMVHRDARNKTELETWWAGFEDPLLTRFVGLALAQNLDIAQAVARVAQSQASLRATDSALLPAAILSA